MNLFFYVSSCCKKCLLIIMGVCAGGKIEKNEMGGACGTYGGRQRGAQGSHGET